MSIEFYVFITSLFLVSIGKIYQTFKTVLYHIYKHLEVSQNTPQGLVFSALFSLFGNVIKHDLSCLIKD